MSVVIQDFEVVAEPAPPPEKQRGKARPRARDLHEIERGLRECRERLARVRAH